MKIGMLWLFLILVPAPAMADGLARTPEQEVEIYKKTKGIVPDKTVAARLAVEFLSPIYGRKEILSQQPFDVKFANGIWTVSGHVKRPTGNVVTLGGVFIVKIAKYDGRVLFFTHGE